MPDANGMVTLGDLAAGGKLLEVGCLSCSRVEYIDPLSLGLPAAHAVTRIAARLKYSRCGARNTATSTPVYARPDARPPGAVRH